MAKVAAVSKLALLLASAIITLANSLSSTAPSSNIRIGTRSSKLALAQAQQFRDALEQRAGASLITELVHIDAKGDVKQGGEAQTHTQTQSLPLAVGGVDFTGALDEAVLSGEVDVAVHSLKDVPPDCRWNADGDAIPHLVIGASLGPRATPLDVLVTRDGSIKSIQALPNGARVGSASIRRQAQLKAIRQDLEIVNVRGNVDSRLRALDDGTVDALVLAAAGLKRLGFADDVDTDSIISLHETKLHCSPIPIETMLPAVGQGIVAVACRGDDAEVLSLLRQIDDRAARMAATTERAFLDIVQKVSPWVGRPPLAGYMRKEDLDGWVFDGLLATPDGSRALRTRRVLRDGDCTEESAHSVGVAAGEEVARVAGESFLDGYY